MTPKRLPDFDPTEPRAGVKIVVSQHTYQENRWRLKRYEFELDAATGLMAAPYHPRLRYYLEREGLPFREEEPRPGATEVLGDERRRGSLSEAG